MATKRRTTTKRRAPTRRRSTATKNQLDQKALLAGLYLAPGVAKKAARWPVIGQLIRDHGPLGLAGVLLLGGLVAPKHRQLLQSLGVGALVSATQPAVTSALESTQLGEGYGTVPTEDLIDLGPEPELAGSGLGKLPSGEE